MDRADLKELVTVWVKKIDACGEHVPDEALVGIDELLEAIKKSNLQLFLDLLVEVRSELGILSPGEKFKQNRISRISK